MSAPAPVLVFCPDCSSERTVSYANASRIRNGLVSGRCPTCRFAAQRIAQAARAEAELSERFWSKVDVRDDDDCWLWRAGTKGGYGQFGIGSRTDGSKRSIGAHRYAYELLVGAVPDGLELDHLCRVRYCVNPAHLEPVTHRENTLRGDTIVARHALTTHCPQGHPYDAQNTRLYQGRRYCRTCGNTRRNARRKRLAV